MLRVIKLSFISCFTLLELSACSSGLHVWYNSSPQHARLICGGQFKGYTPYNLYYNISEQDIQQGVVQVVPCQAVWMSGATEAYRNQFPVNSTSHSYALTAVSRNVTAADVQFDAAKSAEYEAYRQRQNQELDSFMPPHPVQTICHRVGTQVLCNSSTY